LRRPLTAVATGLLALGASAAAGTPAAASTAADDGAVTRGRLVLDTLTMLKAANDGRTVIHHDAAT
jgi:hypothetical protein